MERKGGKRRRLYLIGIDSAPLWIIKKLRHFHGYDKFFSEGTMVDLESTMPPMTGPSWPSIYTGLNPAKHGVPDFFYMKKDYAIDVAFYHPEKVPPVWEKLGQLGKRCLVITPATVVRLPKSGNVDMITGFPLKSKSNSPKLESLMKKHNFHGEPDIEKEMMNDKLSLERSSAIYTEAIRKRAQIAKEMLEEKDYDFVYVCFTETDRMQHASLNEPEHEKYIMPLYTEISKFIDYITKRAKEEDAQVLIVSDHGAQPIREKFLINTFLIDHGFASFKESVQKDLKGPAKSGKMSIRYAIREKLLTTKLRKVYDKMPHQLKKQVFNISATLFSKISKDDYTHIHLYDLDMSKTKAFAAISNLVVGTIWINDCRFEKGTVKASEKQKLKREIIEKLRKAKSKEGDSLFVNVFDADSYYGKTDKFIAPDIMAEIKESYTMDVKFFSLKSMFMKPERAKSGDHTKFGIFGMYPKIQGMKASGVKVTDIAPLILKYFR
ncbi:MAG: alkaline phosphatase family protein [Candidatus Micrarchaeales archaeon]